MLAIDLERSTELALSMRALGSESESVIDLIRAAENLSEISTGVVGRISDMRETGSAVSRAVAEAIAKAQGFRLPLEAGPRPGRLAEASPVRRARRQAGPGAGGSPTTYENGPTRLEGPRVSTSASAAADEFFEQVRDDILVGTSTAGSLTHGHWLARALSLEAQARAINHHRVPAPLIRLRPGAIIPSTRHWAAWATHDTRDRMRVSARTNAGLASRGAAATARAIGRGATVVSGVLTVVDAYDDGRAEWTASGGDSGSTTYAVIRSVVGDLIDTSIAGGAGMICGAGGGLASGPMGIATGTTCAGFVAHKTDGTGEEMIDGFERMATETDDGVKATTERLNLDDTSDDRGLGQRLIDLVDVRPGR